MKQIELVSGVDRLVPETQAERDLLAATIRTQIIARLFVREPHEETYSLTIGDEYDRIDTIREEIGDADHRIYPDLEEREDLYPLTEPGDGKYFSAQYGVAWDAEGWCYGCFLGETAGRPSAWWHLRIGVCHHRYPLIRTSPVIHLAALVYGIDAHPRLVVLSEHSDSELTGTLRDAYMGVGNPLPRNTREVLALMDVEYAGRTGEEV